MSDSEESRDLTSSGSESSGSSEYSDSSSEEPSKALSSSVIVKPLSTSQGSTNSPQVSPIKVSGVTMIGPNHPALQTPLVDQIKAKWERPMNLLPIHTDFLRMFPGMSLEEDGELLVEKYRDSDPEIRGSKESAMRDFFVHLAERDEDDSMLAAWVKRKFFEYIPDGASAEAAQTPIHFQRLLRDVIPETSSIAGVLRCLNQAVPSPAVMILKLKSMANKLLYKDCRGLWDCHVAFDSDKITVSHIKWEESMPRAYEFAWKLEIEMTRDGKTVTRSTLSLHAIRWLPTASDADKEKLKVTFKEFISTQTQEITEGPTS